MRLSEFAFMPYSDDRGDYRNHVANAAISEEWGPDLRYLKNYIHDNFEIAYSQGLVKDHPDGRYALFRVGSLATREGEPITILVVKNRMTGKQPYVYKYTFSGPHFDVILEDETFPETAPDPPVYDIPPYEVSYKLRYNFEHFLEDHEDRASETFPKLSPHQRFLCIYAALELAHKRGANAAVPQWFRDKNAQEGGYQWLLPLYVNSENLSEKPDLVATLDPISEWQEYNVRTLLPPGYAYGHARAVSSRDPSFRAWA